MTEQELFNEYRKSNCKSFSDFLINKIAELEKEKDKAWWEGFDTCKAKSGEANIKLNDELEKLKKQLEELPDKWCRNKDDYCPHLAKLEKENAELKKEWQEQVQKATDEGYARTLQTIQLTKAKEKISNLLEIIVRPYQFNAPQKIQMVKEAEQFISEVEK